MTLETFTSDVLPLKNKLYRFAKSILDDGELAKDVVQETLMKIWEKRQDMGKVQNLEAWCMTITRNFALSKYRLKDNQNEGLDMTNERWSSHSNSPYQLLESSDVFEKIEGIVSGLPLKMKEVFQLRDVEGYAYQEICDITGYQLSDVKVSILRARKVIRQNLQKIYDYERNG